MKYLERAINFITRYYILAVPLFISTALAALLGSSTTGLLGIIRSFTNEIRFGNNFFAEPFSFIKLFAASVVASGLGLINLLLKLAVNPATYGMINKALDEGYASIHDFVPQLKNNFAKYLIYWLGNIVVWIIAVICVGLITLVGSLIVALVKWAAIRVLFILFIGLLFFIAAIYIEVNMALWFPAMLVDHLDFISAFKRSFSIVKKNFWMILGISLLVSLVSSLVNLILSVFGIIPLIGSIILSIMPTVSTFLMMVFYLMFYKDQRINYFYQE